MLGGKGQEREGSLPVTVYKEGGLLGVQWGGDSLCLHAQSSCEHCHVYLLTRIATDGSSAYGRKMCKTERQVAM